MYEPIERLLPRAGGSVYRLVRMAATRALEVFEGKPRLIEKTTSEKPTTIALQEIAEGKIQYVEKNSKEKKEDKKQKDA